MDDRSKREKRLSHEAQSVTADKGGTRAALCV